MEDATAIGADDRPGPDHNRLADREGLGRTRLHHGGFSARPDSAEGNPHADLPGAERAVDGSGHRHGLAHDGGAVEASAGNEGGLRDTLGADGVDEAAEGEMAGHSFITTKFVMMNLISHTFPVKRKSLW